MPLTTTLRSMWASLICTASTSRWKKAPIPLTRWAKPGCTARTLTTSSDDISWKNGDLWVAIFIEERSRRKWPGPIAKTQKRHPCQLGPRRPWRGTLCSSAQATRVSRSVHALKKMATSGSPLLFLPPLLRVDIFQIVLNRAGVRVLFGLQAAAVRQEIVTLEIGVANKGVGIRLLLQQRIRV